MITAVYCTDYYAEEIAAETSGQSNSTFYTDTYGDYHRQYQYKWICPNLTETTIQPEYINNLNMIVDSCHIAKNYDPDFEPDLICATNNDTIQAELMKNNSNGYTLNRQRVSSNFVPSLYHESQQLQHYVSFSSVFMKWDESIWVRTNVFESINTFRNNFFLPSAEETVLANSIADGYSVLRNNDGSVYYYTEWF